MRKGGSIMSKKIKLALPPTPVHLLPKTERIKLVHWPEKVEIEEPVIMEFPDTEYGRKELAKWQETDDKR